MSTMQKAIIFSILTVCMISVCCIKIPPPPPTCRECTVNETLNECASPCAIEPTCQNRNPPIADSCIERCDRRCECKPGYIRIKKNGKCIKQEQCPCGPNETNGCRPCCGNPTCANRNPQCDRACAAVCIDQCECKEGYVLNNIGGKCIPEATCPKE